ncbi:MAG: hypothetical protein AB7E84_18855 [Xanthobacteraceae bacterium]
MLRYPPPAWHEGPFFIAAVSLAVVVIAILIVAAALIWQKHRTRAK